MSLSVARFSYVLLAAATILVGCGGSGSSGPENATGVISLAISDGPVHDAEKVCISFNEIEFKGEGQSIVVELEPAESVDLLEFQGSNSKPILVNQELPAGQYQWVRLGVDAERGGPGGTGNTADPGCDGPGSYIVMEGGAVYNLYVPSSAQNGLKLVGGFEVPDSGIANLTAEFDLMKSVTAPSGLSPDVILRPTIRLVSNDGVGTLTGQVGNLRATETDCAPSVYVFNDGVVPNAIVEGESDPADPVATAIVEEQMNDLEQIEYHYTVGFLMPGLYEVAFTCDGSVFTPELGTGAEIFVNTITTVDFPDE
jgi:hypothetical protein